MRPTDRADSPPENRSQLLADILSRMIPVFAEMYDDLTNSDDSGDHELLIAAKSALASYNPR